MQFQVFFQVRKATNDYFTSFNFLCFFTDCPGYLSKSGKKRKPPTIRFDVSTTITKKPRIDNTLTSLNSEVHSCDVEDDSTDISIGSTCTNPKICEQNECSIPKAQDNTHSTNWGIALEKLVYLNSGLINRLMKSYLLCFRQKLLMTRSRLSKELLLNKNQLPSV